MLIIYHTCASCGKPFEEGEASIIVGLIHHTKQFGERPQEFLTRHLHCPDVIHEEEVKCIGRFDVAPPEETLHD